MGPKNEIEVKEYAHCVCSFCRTKKRKEVFAMADKRHIPPVRTGNILTALDNAGIVRHTDRTPKTRHINIARQNMVWYGVRVPKGALYGFDYTDDRPAGRTSQMGVWYSFGESAVKPVFRKDGVVVADVIIYRVEVRPDGKEWAEAATPKWEKYAQSHTARRLVSWLCKHPEYEYSPYSGYRAGNGMRVSRGRFTPYRR